MSRDTIGPRQGIGKTFCIELEFYSVWKEHCFFEEDSSSWHVVSPGRWRVTFVSLLKAEIIKKHI